ncbi:MAG: hypothetical protein IPM17_02055 [Verrucomicrobia bacterium]|nr:hypothetical protein [Verrucomicrobiota bacterium]
MSGTTKLPEWGRGKWGMRVRRRVSRRWGLVALGAAWVLGALAQTVQVTLVGQWPGYVAGYAEGVAVSGHYAYVADGWEGLQVIDVSDPAHPVRVGGYNTPGRAQGVAVSGHYAYVADGWGGLAGD